MLRLGQVRGVAEEILGRPLRQRFHFVRHHLAHAASAYFPSGFDRAAILTIDGIGEAAGSSLAKAVGTRIQPVETIDYPHSIGFVWEIICGYLGFSPYDASKSWAWQPTAIPRCSVADSSRSCTSARRIMR